MEKKVINYWDDYDPTDIDPTKRPTTLNKTIEIEVNSSKSPVVENKNTFDQHQNWQNILAPLEHSQEKVVNYEEEILSKQNNRKKPDFQNTNEVEIDQSIELDNLDNLNLTNGSRFTPIDEDQQQQLYNGNNMFNRWKTTREQTINKKLDAVRSRTDEPRIEGRRKYSFFAPESLQELLKKPKEVILDASPKAGYDEHFIEKKIYNNPNLIHQVQSSSPTHPTAQVKTPSFESKKDILQTHNEEKDYNEPNILESERNLPNPNQSLSSFLNNAKKNIAASKSEATIISADVLDPQHLTPAQRIRLLKLADDPNNMERKMLLQMKLNQGMLSSLSATVKERLNKMKRGELDIEEEDWNDNEEDS